MIKLKPGLDTGPGMFGAGRPSTDEAGQGDESMKRDPELFAYCARKLGEGNIARGFVLATSIREAKAKARERIKKERHAFARWAGMKHVDLFGDRPLRAYVWRDPEMASAPAGNHYIEEAS